MKTTPAPTIADVLAPYCERTPNTDTGTRYEVEFTASEVADAMESFEQTIHRIETTRKTNGWSNLDPNDLPDIAACDECPVRHDCEARDYDSY